MNYKILEGAQSMRLDDIVRLLRTTYWAGQRSVEKIVASLRHSACYGIWLEDERKLVGFARVITDYATTYYLCDVIIDEAYRGKGLGKALLAHITAKYAGLRGLLLTRDAHGLYRQFGFETADGRAMVKGNGRVERAEIL
ncbi:MAG: GNAT family N-acetyltransferase [Clostridia bacterium]|nr:GNAT family N-acetyltransferase [Clostridia bacterium]MBR4537476.1 GNAT family N-acetyltransferase [Clostridia bacterium]